MAMPDPNDQQYYDSLINEAKGIISSSASLTPSAPATPPSPGADNSLFQDLGNAVVSTIGNTFYGFPGAVMGWGGQLIGNKPMEEAGKNMAREANEFSKLFPQSVESFTDVKDVSSAAHYAAGLAGSVLGSAPLGMGASYLGGRVGKSLATEALSKMLPAEATAQAVPLASKYITRGAMAGGGAGGVAMEAGQIASTQMEKNNELSAAHGIPTSIIAGLTEVLPFMSMFQKTGQWNKILAGVFGVGEGAAEGISRSPGFVNLMGSILKQGVKQMPAEAGQEFAQGKIEQVGVPGTDLLSKESLVDDVNNIFGGGMGGLMFGGAAGAGARVRQNAQPGGARLSDIFQTDVGGPAVEPGLPALPPDPELTYLGRREYPRTAPPGLPEPTNMLPEPVDSLGNRIPYSGSVPPAPELGPNQRTWFPYGNEGDETAYPTSSAAQQVDLTASPSQPPATGTVTPSAPVDLTSPAPKTQTTPSIAMAVEETSKISSLLDETTDLDTQVHPTTGDLVILDPDQSLASIMQAGGALFNESYRSWVVPRSKLTDLIPELQAAAPMPDNNLASKSLETAASNAVGQPVQFGDVVARRGKTQTPKPTSSEISPIEQMINQKTFEQPVEPPAAPETPPAAAPTAQKTAQQTNQSRMNDILEASGLSEGKLASKKGPTEGAVEPRTGITMLDGRYSKALGAGDKTKSGEEIKAAPYSQEIRDRQGKSWMAESEDMKPAAGESARSIQKLAIYHPENNATGTPERIIMSGTEGWRTSGRIPHAIDIDNHYDANQDFFKLWPKAQAIAAENPSAHPRTVFSNLVRQQGYGGYVSDAEATGRERWAFSFTPIQATPAMESAKVGVSPVLQGISKVPQGDLAKLMDMSEKKQGKMDKVINETAQTFPEIQLGFRTSPTVYYGEQSDNSDEHGVVIQLDNITERTLSAFASELGAKHDQNTVLIASPADNISGAKFNSINVSFSLGQHSLDEVSEVMRSLKAPFNIIRESDGSLTMEYLVPKSDTATMQKFTRAAKIFAADGKLNKDNYFAEFISKDQYHERINTYFGETEGTTRYNAAKEAGVKHTANVKSGRYAAGPQGAAKTSVQGDTESAAGSRLTIHEQLTKVAKEVSKKLPAKLKIQVIHSATELPPNALRQMGKLSRDSVVYGYMDPTTNTTYLVSSAVKNVNEAYEILAHELIAHYSLYEMLGHEKFNKLMQQIYDSAVRDPALLKTMLELNKSYQFDRNKVKDRLHLAEELVAHTAETSQNPSWFQDIISSIREWLRDMGLHVSWTDQDIRALLRRSSDWLFDGEGGKFTLTNARGNFLAKEIGVLDSGTAIIQTDKLDPAAPPADISYLANGKAVPLLKDLPADPSVHKLWAGVHSVVRSIMDPSRSYEGLNRSMVEDMLGHKPTLSGPAAAAWTDLQNFYASVLGTSTEPKRVKVTTETTDMPERMARFAVKRKGVLQDDDFYKQYLLPYMDQAKREIDMAGEVGIQEFIRKNRPTVNSDSKTAVQNIAALLDEYSKSLPQEQADNEKIIAQERVTNWKEEVQKTRDFVKRFKEAVDIYRNVWIQALDQQAGKTDSKPVGRQEYLVNGQPIPDFSQSNSQAVQVTMEKIHNLLKIISGQSSGKRLYAQLAVQKVLKNVGKGELGSWRPGLSQKTFTDLVDLRKWYYDTFGRIDWRNPPEKLKSVDVKMMTPGTTSTVRDNGGSFLVRQGKPPSGPVTTEYKLLRTLKTRPGEIFSLFIGNKESIPVGEWLTAEPLPTAGFADRPGWHTSKLPSTKHLSEANRVWAEVEVPATAEDRVAGKPPSPNGQYKFPRPASQGGEWTISGSMKVVKILQPKEVDRIRSGKFAVRGEVIQPENVTYKGDWTDSAGKVLLSDYIDNVTGSNFAVQPGGDMRTNLLSMRQKFVDAGNFPQSIMDIPEGKFAVRNDVNGQFTQPNDRWYSQPLTLADRFKESMNSVKSWWNERISPQLQHFKDLNYKDPSQLPIVEYLRQAEEIPRYARELVGRMNQRLLVILKNPQDRDTYEHLSVLRDMLREATIGMVFQRGPQQVTDFLHAQGYADIVQLQHHIAHFESLITPAVNEALNLRKSFWDRWRRKAVSADILPDSILENEDYFHHQVKQWQELNEKFSGTAPGMHKTKKSFQKGRTGFAGEYNLNYFESETGVLVDLITQVQTAKSLQDIRNDAKLNVLPRLVAEADRLNSAAAPGTPKETWKTVLKRGNILDSFGNPITEQTHEFYKPVRGNFFHKVLTLTERSIRKVMEELQNVIGPDPSIDELMDIARIHAGKAIAVGLRQPLIENYMVLNRQIIRTMENFQEQSEPTFLGRMTSYLQTQWKRWILFNPFRVTRYLLNNTTGDADIAFAFRPAIFKHIPKAYKQLYQWAYKDSAGLSNAERNTLETLNRKGVLGSGITVQEIPELSDDTLTKLINDPRPQLIKRWFKGVHKFNNFRENIMRLAAWEYMNAEAQAGRFDALNYAASKKAEIDAIDSLDDKIVKMSRELVGDYGNLSYVGVKLRKYVIPFWSWVEINAPRYFKMMKNELRAGNTRGGLKIAAIMGGKAAVRAGAFAALVMAWNFAFFRDEEEEMRRLGRDQLHLILGRHSDNSVISLRVQGSFSDTLGWIGAENLLEELRSLKKGRVTPKEEAKSIAMAPVKRLIGGITPLYKTAAEAATGKALFPDPLNPRPIRDKFQHVMKGMGLDFVTDRWVSGKPAPPLFSAKTIASPFLYITDTHEAAYFHSIKLANDWLKEQGMPRTSSEPTPRSNALYYWRQATKLKDKDGEAHYKALYLKLGGQEKGMKQSIKHTDPLVVIPLKHRAKFLSSMGEDNKKTWRLGVRWWQETFKGYPQAPGNSSDSED